MNIYRKKIRSRICFILLLGMLSAQELQSMHVAIAKVCAYVLKAQAIKYIARSIPGVGAALLAKNISDIASGQIPELELNDQAVQALKQSSDFQKIQSTLPANIAQQSTRMPALVQSVVKNAQQQRCVTTVGLPGAFQTLSGASKAIPKPTNVDWRAGVCANAQLKSSFFQHVQQPRNALSFSTEINGQSQVHHKGTSPFGVRLSVDTGADSSWGYNAAKAFQAQQHQKRLAQAALHELPRLKSHVSAMEKHVQGFIHQRAASIKDVLQVMQNVDASVIKSQQLLVSLENDIKAGRLHHELFQGACAVHNDMCSTAKYVKGAFCDSSGNIVGLDALSQKKMMTQIYGDHCKRIGYGAQDIAHRTAQIMDKRLQPYFERTSFYVNQLKDTPFNQDLVRIINFAQHGYASQARALVDKYNPERFGTLSNWWHGRGQLYKTADNAYMQVYNKAYNKDGFFKAFMQHPQWKQLQKYMKQYPAMRNQVLRKLQNEYAFSMQTLHKAGVGHPTQVQLRNMFELCQYSYLDGFEAAVAKLRSYSDIEQFRALCAQKHSFLSMLQQESGCSLQFWDNVLDYQSLLEKVQHDPHVGRLLGSIERVRDVDQCMHVLEQRLHAADLLLKRCGVHSPNELSRVLSYHLVDNYHDPRKMLDCIAPLSPHDVSVMVRQSYADFFDEYGVQKLLPIQDEVRSLFQKSLANGALHNRNDLRNAFNKLAAIVPRHDKDVAVVKKGLAFLEQALSADPQAKLFADYVPQFVDALITPGEHKDVLVWSDLLDAYRLADSGKLKDAFGNVLRQSMQKGAQENVSSLTSTLHNVVKQMKKGQVDAAQNLLSSISSDVSNVVDVPVQDQKKPISPPLQQEKVSSSSSGHQQQHNTQDRKLFSLVQKNSRSAMRNDWGKACKEAARFTAVQHIMRNGFPGFPSNRAAKQGLSSQAEKRRLLLNLALKDRFRLEALDDSKGKGSSASAFARRLLEEGDILAEVEDGFVVRDDDMFAHVHKDGSVYSFYPEHPNMFEHELLNTKKQFEKRSSGSSSSSGFQDFEDWLNAQKKRHKGNAHIQAQPRRTSSSAGGGAPPPNDPRNNRNKSQFSNEPKEPRRSGQKITSDQKNECIEIIQNMGFTKIRERSHGQAIFRKGKRYVSFDDDAHNGGVWKMARSVEKLQGRHTRMGTYDKFLKQIGD